MKGNIMPRLSTSGIALAAALAVVGWFAAPVWAGPPEGKGTKAGEATTEGSGSTFEQFIADKVAPAVATKVRLASAGDEDSGDVEDRLARLEEKLAQLADRLEHMAKGLPGGRHARPAVPAAPRAPRAPRAPAALRAPKTPRPLEEIQRIESFTTGATISRRYELPPGKLEALTALMARDDVPILIRPLDDAIEVHAAEAHQVIFKHFVNMLDGSKDVRPYHLSEGKLRDLTELMVRSDVPVLVEPGSEAIKVHSNALEQAVFGAFVRMIDRQVRPMEWHDEGGVSLVIEGDDDADEMAIVIAGKAAEKAKKRVKKAVTRAEAKAQKRAKKAHRKAEKKIKRIRKRHAEHEDEHTSAHRHAHPAVTGVFHAGASDAESEIAASGAEIEAKAEMIRAKAEALRAEAQRLREEAEKLEKLAEDVDEHESNM